MLLRHPQHRPPHLCPRPCPLAQPAAASEWAALSLFPSLFRRGAGRVQLHLDADFASCNNNHTASKIDFQSPLVLDLSILIRPDLSSPDSSKAPLSFSSPSPNSVYIACGDCSTCAASREFGAPTACCNGTGLRADIFVFHASALPFAILCRFAVYTHASGNLSVPLFVNAKGG